MRNCFWCSWAAGAPAALNRLKVLEQHHKLIITIIMIMSLSYQEESLITFMNTSLITKPKLEKCWQLGLL